MPPCACEPLRADVVRVSAALPPASTAGGDVCGRLPPTAPGEDGSGFALPVSTVVVFCAVVDGVRVRSRPAAPPGPIADVGLLCGRDPAPSSAPSTCIVRDGAPDLQPRPTVPEAEGAVVGRAPADEPGGCADRGRGWAGGWGWGVRAFSRWASPPCGPRGLVSTDCCEGGCCCCCCCLSLLPVALSGAGGADRGRSRASPGARRDRDLASDDCCGCGVRDRSLASMDAPGASSLPLPSSREPEEGGGARGLSPEAAAAADGGGCGLRDRSRSLSRSRSRSPGAGSVRGFVSTEGCGAARGLSLLLLLLFGAGGCGVSRELDPDPAPDPAWRSRDPSGACGDRDRAMSVLVAGVGGKGEARLWWPVPFAPCCGLPGDRGGCSDPEPELDPCRGAGADDVGGGRGELVSRVSRVGGRGDADDASSPRSRSRSRSRELPVDASAGRGELTSLGKGCEGVVGRLLLLLPSLLGIRSSPASVRGRFGTCSSSTRTFLAAPFSAGGADAGLLAATAAAGAAPVPLAAGACTRERGVKSASCARKEHDRSSTLHCDVTGDEGMQLRSGEKRAKKPLRTRRGKHAELERNGTHLHGTLQKEKHATAEWRRACQEKT